MNVNMREKEPRTEDMRGQAENGDPVPKPRFGLGQVVGTPGALRALEDAEQMPSEYLARHVTGDWGDLCDEDKAENELSVERSLRVFSSYKLRTDVKVWVITEWDRSVTTLLLPEEY